ncbi:MAG: bifunctional methyltransferase/pyrophosphohydrolase YabN [Bacilli bacterium]
MGVIHIVGLGGGSVNSLPYGTLGLLGAGHPAYIRTVRHPVVSFLDREGITYTALDSFYETASSFAGVYEAMAGYLLGETDRHGEIVFAVPGHPAMAERTVRILAERAPSAGHQIVYGPGQSFLDDMLLRIGVDPVEGLLLLDADDVDGALLRPVLHTVIVQMYNTAKAMDVKAALAEIYGDVHEVVVARGVGLGDEESIRRIPLYELDRLDGIDHLTSLYVPPLRERSQRLGEWSELLQIVSTLRSPDGCPWDIEQTHQSLRPYVIEEAYEVAEAIDNSDVDALVDELGDLLLQVALHSQIGQDEGYFTVRDVTRALSEKLIRRHPHVFGDAEALDAEAVKANWQRIKSAEKPVAAERPYLLDRVKRAQPPLLESGALQAEAALVGFDWPDRKGVFAKIAEEIVELEQAVTVEDQLEELGDLLFSVVNLARRLNLDPERACRMANDKFRRRFNHVERQLEQRSLAFSEVALDILEEFWQNAKGKDEQ